MIKVIILGFGNVGQHLYQAFSRNSKVDVIQVYNRSPINFSEEVKARFITDIRQLKEADIYIIAVPDDTIQELSKKLPLKNKLVVHTSGSVALNHLSDNNKKGVFYPLQTFSKNAVVDFKTIPICIEANNKEDLESLKQLGSAISENIQEINSKEREQLHLSAVFVNNFVNYLYQVGSDLLLDNSLSFDLLKPLIKETAKKMESLNPVDSQTGPAKRNDIKTIENHLLLLEGSPYKELYHKITKSIQEKYNHGKKL